MPEVDKMEEISYKSYYEGIKEISENFKSMAQQIPNPPRSREN